MKYPIDSRCPQITNENWEECCRLGWRHYANVSDNKTFEVRVRIQNLQVLHGALNVTTGFPFSDEALKPQPDHDQIQIGIYICDVSEQVSNLYAEMDRWESS